MRWWVVLGLNSRILLDNGGLEAAMLAVSFYQPISLFLASPLVVPCLVSGIVCLVQLLLGLPIEVVSYGESFLECACP